LGRVNPALIGAFGDSITRATHAYELTVVVVVLARMISKPSSLTVPTPGKYGARVRSRMVSTPPLVDKVSNEDGDVPEWTRDTTA
jgi:hypothetical protein